MPNCFTRAGQEEEEGEEGGGATKKRENGGFSCVGSGFAIPRISLSPPPSPPYAPPPPHQLLENALP